LAEIVVLSLSPRFDSIQVEFRSAFTLIPFREGAMPKRILSLVFLSGLLLTIAGAQNVVPPTPTNLRATVDPMLMTPMPVIKLTWDAPEGPWGFTIYRSAGDQSSFQLLAKANTRLFYDRGVAGGTKYFYYVRSFVISADGQLVESEPSNVASVDPGIIPPVVRGVIAGGVKDDTTGKGIQGIAIRFLRQGSGIMPTVVPTVYTDAMGQYKAELDTGTYLVRADPPPSMPPGPPQYLGEWYDNVQEVSRATPVRVEEGRISQVNFGLSRGFSPVRPTGVITGKVIDDTTKKPIPRTIIRFYRLNITTFAAMPPSVMTDSLGIYRVELDTGTYLVRAEGQPMESWPGYQPEWFDDAKEIKDAKAVKVGERTEFIADFGLSRFRPPPVSTIEGDVTDTLGVPLRRALVVIMRSLQEMNHLALWMEGNAWPSQETVEIEGLGYCRGTVWKGYTDSTGHFRAAVQGGGKYIAMASKWGYLTEFYREKPTPILADVIAADGAITGIDFTLGFNPGLQNSISGVVRDSLGAGVPSRIVLFPVRSWWPLHATVRFGLTDASGAYTLSGLRAGKYFVLAVPFSGYAPAFYKAGASGVMCWQRADTVNVSGDVTGIDIGVVPIRPKGVIVLTGRVLSSDGQPLDGVRVFATSAGGGMAGFGMTDRTGAYMIEGLAPGSVELYVDRDGYVSGGKSVDLSPAEFAAIAGDIRLTAAVTTVSPSPVAPTQYQLHQNYPNPFNPSTTIGFDMPVAGAARVAIYNLLGQEVVTLINSSLQAGRNRVVWNGKDRAGNAVAGGIYFVRFTALSANGSEQFSQIRKMVLLK
jgi:Carboxypeptidase regulatory-like domain/FlgD Ig-like domain